MRRLEFFYRARVVDRYRPRRHLTVRVRKNHWDEVYERFARFLRPVYTIRNTIKWRDRKTRECRWIRVARFSPESTLPNCIIDESRRGTVRSPGFLDMVADNTVEIRFASIILLPFNLLLGEDEFAYYTSIRARFPRWLRRVGRTRADDSRREPRRTLAFHAARTIWALLASMTSCADNHWVIAVWRDLLIESLVQLFSTFAIYCSLSWFQLLSIESSFKITAVESLMSFYYPLSFVLVIAHRDSSLLILNRLYFEHKNLWMFTQFILFPISWLSTNKYKISIITKCTLKFQLFPKCHGD